jgi:opacity protein-like surface antigen
LVQSLFSEVKKMKRLVVVLAVFMLAGSAAFAAPDVNGKMMLGVNGDYGLNFIGGSLPEGSSSGAAITYGLGAKAGYGITSWGMVYGGLEYQYRNLKMENTGGGSNELEQKYIDMLASFRFFFSSMYADTGLFYGIRVGDMTNNGDSFPKSYTKNDFGLLLGLGFLIPIGESMKIDLGLKFKVGIANAVDAPGAQIKSRTAALTAGCAMFF